MTAPEAPTPRKPDRNDLTIPDTPRPEAISLPFHYVAPECRLVSQFSFAPRART